MSTLVADMRENIRAILDDMEQAGTDTFTADGVEKTISLTEVNIVVDGSGNVEEITLDDIVSTPPYTVDSDRGFITFDPAIASSVEVVIKYRFFKSYANSEIDKATRLAVSKAVMYGFSSTWDLTDDNTINATLTLKERGLIAAVAAVILNPFASISFTTGESRFSAKKGGAAGEQLIKDIIGTAKISGGIVDFYTNVAGVNNLRTLDGEEIEYNV